jgi:hypothetical protein
VRGVLRVDDAAFAGHFQDGVEQTRTHGDEETALRGANLSAVGLANDVNVLDGALVVMQRVELGKPDQIAVSGWVDEKRDLACRERQKPRSAKIGAIRLSTGA